MQDTVAPQPKLQPAPTNGDQRIVPHTGYYSLSGQGVGEEAFLAISTTQSYSGGKLAVLKLSMAVSLDGKSSRNYTDLEVVGSEGDTLDVSVRDNGSEALRVSFERVVGGGMTGRCAGTAGGTAFAGVSMFNQAPLEVFAGNYFGIDGQRQIMTIEVGANGTTIRYADPAGSGPMLDYPTFSYVPDMYVLSLDAVGSGPAASIMLGTGGALGLVAGINTPGGIFYAVSVPPAMPVA